MALITSGCVCPPGKCRNLDVKENLRRWSEMKKATPFGQVRPAPTTWTTLQQHGPNHLGMCSNMLPEHRMALITSGLVATDMLRPDEDAVQVRLRLHHQQERREVHRRHAGAAIGLTAAVPMEDPYCSCRPYRRSPPSG